MAAMKAVIGTEFGADAHVVPPRWVVISLLNTLAALSFAVAGVALGSTVLIIVGMVVGGSG
jgi:NAD/NADP transhydrogenase beta subunit